MNTFLTDLVIKEITDAVFELVSPLLYHSKKFGELCIEAGFQTNLASVPRLPVVYNLWGNRAHREAVLHDASFCKDFPWKLSYSQCNRLFLEAMISTGKPFYISYPMYAGVCMGGWPYYHKRKINDKLIQR